LRLAEDDVDLFEGAVGGLRIEEIDDGKYESVATVGQRLICGKGRRGREPYITAKIT
jgi:hypothetical protein